MPGDRDDSDGRRSVVPEAAARSLWLAAVWTGVGAALVSIVVSIVTVAICWLPAAGAAGSAGSAVRAGLLTFLASLHGGITVDGVPTAFLPLGMTVLAGVVAWRAGAGLADVVADLDERDPSRLVQAGGLQAVSFAVVCAVVASLSTLGSSSVSPAGAAVAGLVLFAVTGGAAFVRSTSLRDEIGERSPHWLAPAARAGVAAVGVYLAFGALLVGFSLIVHHAQVQTLSADVGGGWSGVPVLLLGVLAAPNAAIAGASYLSGPGFAVGSGSVVALGSSPHGTLPAFPVLGALPSAPASPVLWVLAVATPLAAGGCVAALARRADTWSARWASAGRAAVAAAVIGTALAWQGGGAIGSGRLNAVGASPWQFGFAVLGGVAVAAAIALAGVQGLEVLRARRVADDGPALTMRSVLSTIKDTGRVDASDEADDSDHDDESADDRRATVAGLDRRGGDRADGGSDAGTGGGKLAG